MYRCIICKKNYDGLTHSAWCPHPLLKKKGESEHE